MLTDDFSSGNDRGACACLFYEKERKKTMQQTLAGILPEQRLQAAIQMRFLSLHICLIF